MDRSQLSLSALVCAWRFDDSLSSLRDTLIRYARDGQASAFECLLQRGTLPASRGVEGSPCTVALPLVVDETGSSLLHLFAMHDGAWRNGAGEARRVLTALAALGCDVNARDLTGATPLIRFAHKASDKLVTAAGPPNLLPLLEAWLDAGAAPSAADAAGFSAGAYLKRARAVAREDAQRDALCAALIELQRRVASEGKARGGEGGGGGGCSGGAAPFSPAPPRGLRSVLSPWQRLQVGADGDAPAAVTAAPAPAAAGGAPAEPPHAPLAEEALGSGALAKLHYAVLLLDRRPPQGARGGCGDGARAPPRLDTRWVAGRGTDGEYIKDVPLKLLATEAPDSEAAPAVALGPCASLAAARALSRAWWAVIQDAAAAGCLARCGCEAAGAPALRSPRGLPARGVALSCDFHAVAAGALLKAGARGEEGTPRARAAAVAGALLSECGGALPAKLLLLPLGAALHNFTRATLPPLSGGDAGGGGGGGGGEEVCTSADDSRALLGSSNPPGALPVGLGSPARPGNPREGALGAGVRKALSFAAAPEEQLAAAVAALSILK